MAFATGAITSLIPKLGKLLKDEYDLQKSVKGGIKFLMLELESMQASLEKVSCVPAEQLEKHVMLWARHVREMSYDIEDTVDTFFVRVEGKRPPKQHNIKGFVDRSLHILSKARIRRNSLSKTKIRRRIATDIQDIMYRVKDAKERRDRYSVDSIVVRPITSASIDPRLAALFKPDTELVGIDEARTKLISMLLDGDNPSKENLRSISVFGIGGLGKTTLAKTVFVKLRAEFKCRAFVSVGQNPDIKKVFQDILLELDRHKYENIRNTRRDEKQLIDLIREFLHNKRYLIVTDDIWDIQSLEAIRLGFMENNLGSRIITTTRNLDIAREAGEVYKLQPLSHDNSKKLFYTRIFSGERNCLDTQPDDDVPDNILKKCGGVPLAVITMASLLAGKQRGEWFEVYSSISFSNKDNQHMENTMKILSYSYFDMPPHLRTCLLYFSVFPEDYVIDKDILIWKWIAEGFIHGGVQGVGLFEIGERYFNELMNRSMIQPVERERELGYVRQCCIHDMVLGLIRSLSSQENSVTILDEQKMLAQRSTRRFSYQIRMMMHNPASDVDMPRARSFVACWCYIGKMVPLSSFRVLRLLALEQCWFLEDYNLSHLGNLHHLRYLGLAGTPICELPKETGSLKFLQTLDLIGTRIEELPSSIIQLTQLMCLRAIPNTRTPPNGVIGSLSSLEELWITDPEPEATTDDMTSAQKFIAELGKLTKLRVLHTRFAAVADEGLEEALIQSISNTPKLHHLFIKFESLSTKALKWEVPSFVPPRCLRYLWLQGFQFSRLPGWINSSLLPNLVLLTVYVQSVDCKSMLTLGNMPELCCLNLYTMSHLVIYGAGRYFPKLRSCFLSEVQIIRNKNGAPVLTCLEDFHFAVCVWFLKHTCNYHGQTISSFLPTVIGLHSIPFLTKIVVTIRCRLSSPRDVEEVEVALKHLVNTHPNHPTLEMERLNEDGMITSDQEQHQSATDSCKVFNFNVHVRMLNSMCYAFNFTNLGNLCSLEKVKACVNCEGTTPDEVEAAEAALRRAIAAHPNHPTLELERYSSEETMKVSCDESIKQKANHQDATAHVMEKDAATTSIDLGAKEEDVLVPMPTDDNDVATEDNKYECATSVEPDKEDVVEHKEEESTSTDQHDTDEKLRI